MGRTEVPNPPTAWVDVFRLCSVCFGVALVEVGFGFMRSHGNADRLDQSAYGIGWGSRQSRDDQRNHEVQKAAHSPDPLGTDAKAPRRHQGLFGAKDLVRAIAQNVNRRE